MSDPTTATDGQVAPEATPEPELLHGVPVARHRGQLAAHAAPDELVGLVRALRDDGWLQCLDLTGVDYLDYGRVQWNTDTATSSGFSRGRTSYTSPVSTGEVARSAGEGIRTAPTARHGRSPRLAPRSGSTALRRRIGDAHLFR